MKAYSFTAILDESITITEIEPTLIANNFIRVDGYKVHGTVKATDGYNAAIMAKHLIHDKIFNLQTL